MNKEEIIAEKIAKVEKEIRDTPYDKASEHHHGVLKAKLSKLKDELDGAKSGGGGGGIGYAIKHSGDASVVLVGLPSVGKSTLLNSLTNAESKIGNYDFTTLGVIPGMMEYKGVKIQVLDIPGIVEGAAKDKGFGRKVLSVIRASDLVVLMSDVQRVDWIAKIENELYKSGIRPGAKPPKVEAKRMGKGSIQVIDPFNNFDKEMIADVAREMGFENAIIQIGEKLQTIDRLVDGLSKNRKYMPIVRVLTKIDTEKKIPKLNNCVLMSAEKGIGIDEFKEKLWKELGLVRVYLRRERSGEADKNEPLIMKNDQNVKDVLTRISSQMRDDITRACIWGKNARFPGQEVSFKFTVFDEMEVWFGR